MDNIFENSSPQKRFLRILFFFIILSFVFGISYSQSPLFTSNQNQYFLHGFADAGYGYLNNDWLASTVETTPIFSLIVKWTVQLTPFNGLFYIYYGLLMGVYFFSLLGIISTIYSRQFARVQTLLFIAVILTIHSAGFRFFLSRTLGDNWKYILEDGLADQRLLGTVFQPSAFGVLLIFSIFLFLKEKPFWAVLFAVLAATIHPTYLLSAAALITSYMVISFKETKSYPFPIIIGFMAVILILPMLVYAWTNFANTPAETSLQAQKILVNFRIPHHARINWWLDSTAILKIMIIATAVLISRNQRIFFIILIPSMIAAILTLVQFFTGSFALALVFPWRLSTFLVPLSTTLILARILLILFNRYDSFFQKHRNLIIFFSIVFIIAAMVIGFLRFGIESQQKKSADERQMFEYVHASHSAQDVYLVPDKMQDFRLETGSPIYVDFKSIPYRDSDVLEWYKRIQTNDRFYKEKDCGVVYKLLEYGDLTRVVIPSDELSPFCEHLIPVYQDDYYGVYSYR